MKNSQNLLSLKKAAQELGIGYETAYRWYRLGEVDTLRIGGVIVTTTEELARAAFRRSYKPQRRNHE